MPDDVRGAYAAQGVARPWRHQVVAADAAHAGDHVIVATGTASGKSLAYQLPALSAIRAARGPRGERGRLGALPRPDQGAGPRPARRAVVAAASTYASRRTTATARARSGTGRATSASTSSPTPTCSTARCCPRTTGGRGCSGRCSTSSSTSATTTAACSGRTSPTCCGGCGGCARCTAPTRRSCSPRRPSREPEVTASRLTGLDVVALTRDDSPRGQVSLLLWEPPFTSHAGENGAPVRRAASSEVADLLADLVAEDVRTLAFIRSRRGAEQVALTAAELLAEVDPSLPGPGRGLPRRLPPRGAPGARGGAAPRRPDRAGRDQRARARHRHQRARRRADRRLPRHPGGVLAAGRAGRPRRAGRARGAGRQGRPARHLPRHPPRDADRRPGRGVGLRPVEPARHGSAPLRGRAGAAAHRGRPAALRTRPPARSSTS